MDENGIVFRKNIYSPVPLITLIGLFNGVVIFGIFFKAHDLTEILLGVIIAIVLTGLSTTEHHDDTITMKLILHFSKYEDEDYDYTHLNIKTKELVEHLLYYKGIFTTYYVGHTKTGNYP